MTVVSKVGIITGAGSGIGRACAIALSKNGWKLTLIGRRAEKLKETLHQCTPGETLAQPGDVTDEKSIRDIFENTVNKWGRIDLLFNNAGIATPPKLTEDWSLDEFKMVLNINVTGSFICAREAFRIMKNQLPKGGRIINNGSISAHVPRPMALPYTTSKHAITGLTKSINLDGRDHHIACGQIDIGNASSEITRQIEEGILQSDGTVQSEPTMDVADVGKALVYMANLPLDTNVPFMTLMANGMRYMGRG